MRWTEWLQETRKMRFEEAYRGWQTRRLTQEEAARLLEVCERTYYINREMLVERELKAVGDIALYRSADSDGKVLYLHYVREQELGPYLYMAAVQGRCMCSFGSSRAIRQWSCQSRMRGRKK